MAAKESSQRKLPLLRRSGPAPWGLHALKNPKEEVARPFGYANAVLLFALNAYGPCSTLNSGVPPNPRWGKWDAVGAGLCSARAVGGGLPPSLAPLAFPLLLRRAACPQAALLCLWNNRIL